jgi:chromate transporter
MRVDTCMSLFKLFMIFVKVSSFTIGGGYAMVPVIKEFIVDKYKLLGEDEFMDVIVTAQTVPGVIAVNTAMILGTKLGVCGEP